MPIFKRIFGRKEQKPIAPIPPWEKIVDHMQGQQLSGFADEVVKVIVSQDRSKRILILQSKNGCYQTVYEEIRVFDEDEWVYFCNDPNQWFLCQRVISLLSAK